MDRMGHSETFPQLSRCYMVPPTIDQVLLFDLSVSAADAHYRDVSSFRAGSLSLCKPFWDSVILPSHPQKDEISDWLDGVRLERFLKRTVEVDLFLGQAYVTGGVPPAQAFQELCIRGVVPLGYQRGGVLC